MKLAVEERLIALSSGQLDVGVLRPTAIVGPGGQNLLKLANSLQSANVFINYVRASALAHRPMHLVPVRSVADALLHLSTIPVTLNGGVYIAASDDDPDNNFQSVEAILMSSLGLGKRALPLVPMPRRALSALLRVIGRTDADTARTFDSGKLRATNFRQTVSVASAVCEFGESIRKGASG
jgi:nucleoside-diphosphate-sugar epimerase